VGPWDKGIPEARRFHGLRARGPLWPPPASSPRRDLGGLPRPSPAEGGAVPRGFPGATLPAAPTPGTGRAREVGQTSLWRRTALGPLSAPAPPPEVGGEPSLHPPSVAPASWLAQEPPGWNHHPKPPAPTGQAYWDGEPTWPGTAVAVALWWPPTLPLGRERPAYAPSRPARPPGLPDPAGIRRFQGRSPPYVLQTPHSGEASFPWGRARGQALPPVGAEAGPEGGSPQGTGPGFRFT